jgi:F-type H+-transporting ATPase subunit b
MSPHRGTPVVLMLADPARAAEGTLQILPTGFAELWAQQGLSWGLLLHIWQLRAFWGLILLFAVLAPLLNRFVFTPLVEVLEERDRRIAGAREQAARIAAEAEELLGRYDAAVQEARDRANAERKSEGERARAAFQERVAAARAMAENQTRAGRQEVEAAVATAQPELRTEAQALAAEIASRLLGRELA